MANLAVTIPGTVCHFVLIYQLIQIFTFPLKLSDSQSCHVKKFVFNKILPQINFWSICSMKVDFIFLGNYFWKGTNLLECDTSHLSKGLNQPKLMSRIYMSQVLVTVSITIFHTHSPCVWFKLGWSKYDSLDPVHKGTSGKLWVTLLIHCLRTRTWHFRLPPPLVQRPQYNVVYLHIFSQLMGHYVVTPTIDMLLVLITNCWSPNSQNWFSSFSVSETSYQY